MTALPLTFVEWPLAHRGLHGAGRPENGISAMRVAVEAGYGIELDVQPSADGQAMVFHDETLDRLTEAGGPIAARQARELVDLPLQGGMGEGIPTLADVLDVVAARVPLLVEIKDQDGGLGPDIGALEAAVTESIKGYDGPLAVMSFNPYSTAEMARLAPDVPRGLVTCDFNARDWPGVPDASRGGLVAMDMLDEAKACFISHDAKDLRSPHVARVKAREMPVLCWTIRSPEAEAEARRIANNVTFEGYLP